MICLYASIRTHIPKPTHLGHASSLFFPPEGNMSLGLVPPLLQGQGE
jgi:hypothetical protein